MLDKRVVNAVDEEIRVPIRKLNELKYVRTVFSCAGYGKRGRSSTLHARHETSYAYVVVAYDTLDPRWQVVHDGLRRIATRIETTEAGYVYRFGARSQAQVVSRWKQVEDLVEHALQQG